MSDELTPRMKGEFTLSPARRAYNSGYYSSPEWKAYMKAYQKEYRRVNKDRLRIEQKRRRQQFRERTNATNRKWRKKNPHKAHEFRLRSKYGISTVEYAALGSACHICGMETFSGRHETHGVATRHIDHDHASGIVRGILCSRCNHGLGNFRDDCDLLTRAIKYLHRHKVAVA